MFSLSLFLLAYSAFVFADDITVTTYYPSPYGSYNELQINRLAVGDTNGKLNAWDQPNRDGDIRFVAQRGDPAIDWPAGTIGQFSYSSTRDALYHYNGSAWVASGGGGIAVISLKCSWGVTYSNPFVGSCVPASCMSGWNDRGVGCASTLAYTSPAGGLAAVKGYCERWCTSSAP